MHHIRRAVIFLALSQQTLQAPAGDSPDGMPVPTPATPTVAYKTSVWVDPTTYRFTPNPHFQPNVVLESRNTVTRTIYEPATITAFPATVEQTQLDDLHYTLYATTYGFKEWGFVDFDNIEATGVSYYSSTGTQTSTWVVHAPEATYLPAGTGADSLPCSECAPANAVADERCAAVGLATACQGQCKLREDGLLWCFHITWQTDILNGLGMGRACWGNRTVYAQLNEPCLLGDQKFGCTPCEGKSYTYSPKKWINV